MKVSGNKLPNTMPSAGADVASKANEAAKASKTAGLEAALTGKTKSSADLGSASKVAVSSRAQDMAKAKELATPSNDIDEAKVARLQALIDKGQYKINAEAVAERLLDEHTKMPG
ncbi:flagellar biosynthesis anti-sigma factor FlgM [bacterium]|nr:MAG: flagellar biosynthesis anti-sigma factor FlgM [bacterium]